METERQGREHRATFDFDNPITGSLSKYDRAKANIHSRARVGGLVSERLGEGRQRGVGGERGAGKRGEGLEGRQRLPLSPSVDSWRAKILLSVSCIQ